jgi:hypothetical protein
MAALTEEQAFTVMVRFLEGYLARTNGAADVALVVADCDRTVFADGQPLDPGAWPDWLRCVGAVLAEDSN